MPLVTFDFHNTIASCDRWFQLEIARFAAEVHARLDGAHTPAERRIAEHVLIDAYRAVRHDVIATGREKDALASVMATFASLHLNADPLAAATTIDQLMHEATGDIAPIPGAIEVVQNLHNLGCTLAVVSSAIYPPFLEWTLEAFGIRECFATVVTSASAGYYKSNPAIYQHALADTGFTPGDAVHIGDSPRWDATTAKEAGMRTILLARGSSDRYRDERDLLTPDLVLESFVGSEDQVARFVLDGAATRIEVTR